LRVPAAVEQLPTASQHCIQSILIVLAQMPVLTLDVLERAFAHPFLAPPPQVGDHHACVEIGCIRGHPGAGEVVQSVD